MPWSSSLNKELPPLPAIAPFAQIVMSSLVEVDTRPRRWYQPRVILPTECWYSIFWYTCMSLALVNAVLDPYKLAFEEPTGFA